MVKISSDLNFCYIKQFGQAFVVLSYIGMLDLFIPLKFQGP